MSTAKAARLAWAMLAAFVGAAVGGFALMIGFAYFNTLHQEFLGANFDAVHGARTLLKAQFLTEMAARDVEAAGTDIGHRQALLVAADRRLLNAESYAAEGREADPRSRAELTERLRQLRNDLTRAGVPGDSAGGDASLAALAAGLHRLARDIDSAELDRWGMLASLNAELSARMRQLNMLIGAIIAVFVIVMTTLGWALLRARRAEAELRLAKQATEAVQQTTLDASPIGIAYIDTANPDLRRVAAVNRQMANIFGYEPDLMIGINVRRLYASQDSFDHFSETMPDRLASGEVIREELVMQRRNGIPFWCSLSVKAIDPMDIGAGVVWTCEDISERKANEEELLQAQARAEAASRAKSEFLANMSHELRTPFAGLFGLLDLLQRSPLDGNQQRYLRFARDSALQMQAIVNDILDFSKIEAGKLLLDEVDFDLRALLESLSETHGASAESKGLCFSLEMVEPIPQRLHADAVRLRQIIDNLLGNAVKFTHHGEVRLAVASRPVTDRTAELEIRVVDTGIGIAPDMIDRIFEKFTQADSSTTRVFGGTGLGLAISNQLALLMGGCITVHSMPGQGSEFMLRLQLPMAEAESGEGKAGNVPAAAAVLRGKRVLIAEDNPINRGMFADQLRHFGLQVDTAENGERAVRLAAELQPDAILMDCQMPIVDGLEAARRIRRAEFGLRHTPIIAVTAFTTSDYREACFAAGMDGFLPKPVTPEAMLAEIAACIERLQLQPLPTLPREAADATHHGRILLVEDNPAIQEATARLLENAGCRVDVAADGPAALEKLERANVDAPQGEYDLVLMDCHLPGIDGWETTRRWRDYERNHRRSPLGIIAMTAEDPAVVRARCREAGMDGTLTKPFAPTDLQALLDEWLGAAH